MRYKRIIISGPSGSGKSTVINYLLEEYPSLFRLSISHTTRKKRPTETNHKEYHFITKEEFLKKVKEKEMFEYQLFNNEYYGTSHEELTNTEKTVLFDLGRVGVEEVANKKIDALFISIICTKELLRSNLINRYGNNIKNEDYIEINERLNEFIKDESFFRSDIFDFIIFNESIEQMKREICSILGLNYK